MQPDSFVSIHPMLMFIVFQIQTFRKKNEVSIHPMLMFICGDGGFHILPTCVSIHPMLMFIYWYIFRLSKHTPVSIHPMLMFIAVVSPVTIAVLPFQYILC